MRDVGQQGHPVRALILDLGNVLIFHDNDRLFRELGAACNRTPAEVQHLIRESGAGERINTTDGPPISVYDAVAPAIDFPGGYAEFAAIWNGIFTPHVEMEPVIERLHGRTPLFVLSNTNPLHMEHIWATLPVLSRIDHVLTSYELGVTKPDQRIYERALAVVNVPAREAAFFDDLPQHVAGARAAGLRAFLFTDAVQFQRDLASCLPAGG